MNGLLDILNILLSVVDIFVVNKVFAPDTKAAFVPTPLNALLKQTSIKDMPPAINDAPFAILPVSHNTLVITAAALAGATILPSLVNNFELPLNHG